MINITELMNENKAKEKREMKEEPKEEGEIGFQLKCDLCDFNCTELARLTEHIAVEKHHPPSPSHNDNDVNDVNNVKHKKKINCDKCDREFKSHHGLAIHTSKSHVPNGVARKQIESRGKIGRKQKSINDNLRIKSVPDPLDFLINQHVLKNQDLVHVSGLSSDVQKSSSVIPSNAVSKSAVDGNSGRWDSTVPVPMPFKGGNF